MKKINVKKLTLSNYKNQQEFETELFNRTIVSGHNAVGKTTLHDAFLDILTGKLADGTTPDGIRPHDENGADINRSPIVREITVTVDGEEHELTKVTCQNWRTPRGTTEEVFDGNETFYKVDGFDKKAKDYLAWLEANIANVDTLNFCVNPNSFLATVRKSATDARKLIERLSGFTIESFLDMHPEFDGIRAKLKGNTVEELQKKYRRDLKSQKQSFEKVKTQYEYESTRVLPFADTNKEQILEDIKKFEAQIAEINAAEAELETVISQYRNVMDEVAKLNYELQQETLKAKDEQNASVIRMQNLIADYNGEIRNVVSAASERKADIGTFTIKLEMLNDRLASVKSELLELSAAEFPESSKNCAYCGSPLPADKLDKLVSDFKAKTESKKEELISKQATLVADISKLESAIGFANDDRTKLKAKYDELTAKVNELKSKIAERQDNPVELEKTPRILILEEEIAIKQEEAKKYNPANSDRKEVVANKADILATISSLKSRYEARVTVEEQHQHVMDMLDKQMHEEAAAVAQIERTIDLLSAFSSAKNKALTEAVNKYFNYIQIKLFDVTQEGNEYETFRIVVNGTDYMNGLNHGARILADIDLACGLQEMNGLNLPVVIDDIESLDMDKVPNIDHQLIMLRRTDEDKLTVKEM